MRRSQICTAAAAAAVSLAASSAMAQTYPQLVFSFETLYNASGTPNTGTFPDGFTNNGGGTTISQSTVGATQGSYSMEFQQSAADTFTGALLSATVLPIPAIIDNPGTVALSLDITVPSTGNFVGNFARLGISEFGLGNGNGSTGSPGQAQTIASSEVNIDLAPGTYHFTIPLISISNPETGDPNVPFSNVFGSGATQYTPTGLQFYINKSTENPLAVYLDNVQAIGAATVGAWANAGGGSWSTLGNWTGGIPTLALDTANLTGAITANSTITLDGNYSVQALNFNNSHQYTVTAGTGGTLTLDAGGSNTATITDSGGTHTISAPVDFNTNTAISVANSGDALNISGPISGIGSLTVSGGGTVDISGSNSYVGGTTVSSGTLVVGSALALPSANSVVNIAAGAKVQLATGIGATTLQVPVIAAGGTFDITNNHLILNDPSGSIDAAIQGYLSNGYNNGNWNGASGAATGGGIVTSAPTGTKFGIGYADGADGGISGITSGQLEVKYTLYGDANLDGSVNSIDFGDMAANFGKSGKVWDQGDFNYDGTVNSIDFGLLAGNFGKSVGSNADVVSAADWTALDAFAAANGLMADVPEPTCAALALITTVGILQRRSRSRQAR
ncbi:MAG TPA: autotransporter-associated beta strand repeat-containing protein [Tepidisphaeraceae bacterium]|jgi:autotransporter-associated beta strand protein|nr:autotransporter-associated beta strand repeat-containing protein [Tepidisphaeraceae bacterium]